MRQVLFLALLMLLATCPSAWAVPAVTLNSTGGQPGASLTVTGSGFAGNTTVDVYFDTTNVALAASTAAGTTSTTITVPASAQPKSHWVTLVARGTNTAAQASYYVQTYWPQIGFGPSGRRANTIENTIGPDNVSGLVRAWSARVSPYGNAFPFVEWGGYLYTVDFSGQVRAYRTNGTLLWTAPIASDSGGRAPVVVNGKVAVPTDGGTVYAFNTTCRTDGGVCTPAWTHSVGTTVTGSLVSASGLIYAPSSDKTVHALQPATGAESAALPATTYLSSSYPAVTQGPAFGNDGSYWYGADTYFGGQYASGALVDVTPGTVGPPAYVNGIAYYTSSDGSLRTNGAVGSGPVTVGNAGCLGYVAVAKSTVFATACQGLGAYDAGTLATRWSTSAVGYVNGLAYANGVLYVCDGTVSAWDAVRGARLWSGGFCNSQPIVVDGALYVTGNGSLEAYDLTSARTAQRHVRRPDPRRLRPDPKLHRSRRGT